MEQVEPWRPVDERDGKAMRHTTVRRQRPILHGRSRRLLVTLCALVAATGLAACGVTEDVISFAEYIDATVDVVEASGMEVEGDANLDCEGSRETKNVTCTAETTEGLSIESTGENLGEDDATLVVTVDDEILYDGLLEEAPNS